VSARVKDEGRLGAWLAETRTWVDAELERALASEDAVPEILEEALRYALFAGGKRVRSGLVRATCATLGGDDAAAAAPAAAVELIHTYSLVHDDLPCMDDDDLRRGRPTCHKVYGEALAVLVGDALQGLAFGWLARGARREGSGARRAAERVAEMVDVLARGAGSGGMVGGQVLDMRSAADTVGADGVRSIHALKTAALMSASAELGGIAAGVDAAARRTLAAFGKSLGLAFQAVDDLLDVTGSAEALGKTPGKDAADDKATLVAALGFEGARREARRLGAEARAALESLGAGPDSLPWALVDRVVERSS